MTVFRFADFPLQALLAQIAARMPFRRPRAACPPAPIALDAGGGGRLSLRAGQSLRVLEGEVLLEGPPRWLGERVVAIRCRLPAGAAWRADEPAVVQLQAGRTPARVLVLHQDEPFRGRHPASAMVEFTGLPAISPAPTETRGPER